jgi:hypothetical protein
MEQEKSRIDSFDVSLGPAAARRPSAVSLEKWNILVCSDLGYASKRPAPLRIAEWNEFMAARAAAVRGTVENK